MTFDELYDRLLECLDGGTFMYDYHRFLQRHGARLYEDVSDMANERLTPEASDPQHIATFVALRRLGCDPKTS